MDKVSYLERENQELRGQLSDLKELLKMNKIQIDVLSSQFEAPEAKKYIQILHKNRQLQQKLHDKLAETYRQNKQLITENFMLKQMNQEQVQQMKAIQILNVNSISSLQNCIKQLEEKAVMMEKSHKEYDKVSGFVLKNRNIFNPTDVSLEIKQKEVQLAEQLQLMSAQLQIAKKKQESLLMINTVLRNKIVGLQAKLAMPNKNLGEVLDRSLKRLMVYFLQVQKKIVTGDDDSESEEQEDLELIAPEILGIFPQKQYRIQKDFGVPQLDLLKIREQITQGIPKIKQALAARNHLSDKQKIQRFQVQLEYTRRELAKNIIDLKNEKDRRKIAEKLSQELQNRNFLLLNSNIQLEQKVKRYWDKLQNILKNRESGGDMDELKLDLESTLISTQLINRVSNKKNRGSSIVINEQINYKVFLELMAKELEDNKKLENLDRMKKIENDELPTLKKSTSNPLLYFNERKGDIMQIKNEEKDERHRLEQTCIQPTNDSRFEENLDGYDI